MLLDLWLTLSLKLDYFCFHLGQIDWQRNLFNDYLMAEKYQLYHLFSLMANLYQILKKRLTNLMNFLVVNVHLLTMVMNVQVSHFCY